jgi:energy-converting hydrogenase A subunit M
MTQEDSYNGWTNRETWAVALWINNEQGWQESVIEALREALTMQVEELTASKAGEIVRENVEDMLLSDEMGVSCTVQRDILHDIGSLYRVDWREVGESFLTDVREQS